MPRTKGAKDKKPRKKSVRTEIRTIIVPIGPVTPVFEEPVKVSAFIIFVILVASLLGFVVGAMFF